jgi:hypothetical protein
MEFNPLDGNAARCASFVNFLLCNVLRTVVQLVVPLVLRINLMWVFYAIYQVEMHVFNFVLEA